MDTKYKKNYDYRQRQLAKGLCERCPTPRAPGHASLCPRHLTLKRKQLREWARKKHGFQPHDPAHPDRGYKDRIQVGRQHRPDGITWKRDRTRPLRVVRKTPGVSLVDSGRIFVPPTAFVQRVTVPDCPKCGGLMVARDDHASCLQCGKVVFPDRLSVIS